MSYGLRGVRARGGMRKERWKERRCLHWNNCGKLLGSAQVISIFRVTRCDYTILGICDTKFAEKRVIFYCKPLTMIEQTLLYLTEPQKQRIYQGKRR